MNIGRTVRVFRAEPVVSPVPGPDDAPVEPAAVGDRADEVEVEVELQPVSSGVVVARPTG